MTCGQCGTEIETGTICPVCAFDNADNAVYTGFLYAETGIRRWVRVFLWISLILSAGYSIDAAFGLLRPTGLLLLSPYPLLLLIVLVLSVAQIGLGVFALQYRLWAIRALTIVHIAGTLLFFFLINYDFEILIFSARLLIGVILALSPWKAFGYTSRRLATARLGQPEDTSIAANILTEEDLEEEIAEEARIDEEFTVTHVSGLGPAARKAEEMGSPNKLEPSDADEIGSPNKLEPSDADAMNEQSSSIVKTVMATDAAAKLNKEAPAAVRGISSAEKRSDAVVVHNLGISQEGSEYASDFDRFVATTDDSLEDSEIPDYSQDLPEIIRI